MKVIQVVDASVDPFPSLPITPPVSKPFSFQIKIETKCSLASTN